MYTSTYSSSSPVRTSTFGGVGPTNYQHQPSNQINYNSYQIMDDGNTSSMRRPHTTYSNSASSLTSIPIHTETPSRKYASHYNNHITSNDFNPNKYQSTSYRSYAGDNEVFRSNTSVGNIRSQSYDDLVNDQNQSYRSQSSVYNSTARTGINNPYGQQTRHDDYDDDLIVKSTDLSASNEQQMMELVRLAFRKFDYNNQRELAGFLKRSADKAFSSCWHCIVGRQFSSYVTHEMNGFIYLTKGPLSILLLKVVLKSFYFFSDYRSFFSFVYRYILTISIYFFLFLLHSISDTHQNKLNRKEIHYKYAQISLYSGCINKKTKNKKKNPLYLSSSKIFFYGLKKKNSK